MKSSIALLLGFLMLNVSVTGQEKLTKKEQKQAKKLMEYNQIKALIEGKAYVFVATKANPSGGSQVDLTTHNADLTIKNDTVISYLPFFGRAYNISYGGSDSGIKFETELLEYAVENNDSKMQVSVTFKAKTANDSYNCNIQISGSGSATLSVSSNNRAHISYYGNIQPVKEPKKAND